MYYLIKEELTGCLPSEIKDSGYQFAAVLTSSEWENSSESFDMGIDMDMDMPRTLDTKAVVNTDSLTGTFSRPALSGEGFPGGGFAYALDEKGIVLVDDTGYAAELVGKIAKTKKWKYPCLERFFYDLLEAAIADDLNYLESCEKKLSSAEDEVLKGDITSFSNELNEIRGDLLDLRVNYEQLIDLGQELQENENGFFKDENLRFFHMFTERVMRLENTVSGQREYVIQIRDLIQTQIDVKQNRTMTLLTVITSIFLPLTLIAGWYGMNFKYMPELNWPYSYPVVIGVCVLIVVACLLWFRKKKWM